MTKDELKSIIEQPHTADKHHLPELLELSRQYPYSSPLQVLILLLLHKVNDLRYASELHERALVLPNLRRLYTQLNTNPTTLVQNEKSPSSESNENSFGLIDAFLEQHPEDSSDIEELLDVAPATPPATQTVVEQQNTEEIISEFLDLGEKAEVIGVTPDTPQTSEQSNSPAKSTSADRPIETEEELFTETLARMYIRQGKYQRAERILTQINLEFPKKSGYFAEQLNFLKKLIENNSENREQKP